MSRRRVYYSIRMIVLLSVLAGVIVAAVFVGDSWWQLAVAAALGVVLTQVVFLSHDAAHRQIFRTGGANEAAGFLMGTGISGISLAWWNNKHSKHHGAPNQIGKDPDITPSVVSFYPLENPPRLAVLRFLHERQGWWFYPLLVVEALNLHLSSFWALLTRPELKRRALEISVMTVRLAGYPALLFVFLPAGKAAAFLGLQLAVTGLYLGASFAVSHIGKPVLDPTARVDFFRRQVLMSRNVAGRKMMTLAMGGLNYQIEHHLFPSMPRPNLRRAQLIVRSYCETHAVEYEERRLPEAWAIVIRYLNKVGIASRDPYTCPTMAALR
ncbi:acyl-CoA desaturase [Nakamurella flavida]|uniref:Acyl-CoA desaturase n=2 Tax=Nakamurella flavida TaxID=363630 RepID=A0A939C228_9ACTN|nr:acyl-CoA desaturase [Nakamurella flavida]